MTNEDIENIRSKAQSCNLSIDLSPEASDIKRTQISVYDGHKHLMMHPTRLLSQSEH